MKVALLLAYAVLTYREVTSAAIQPQLHLNSLNEDIRVPERRHLEYLTSDYINLIRIRRSSDEALHSLKASVGHGIKSKLGLLAKGSASASSSFSSGSSGKHSYHHHDVHSDHDEHKSFDLWSLKKSILNTLLQAVKAIKGGVIAIKGQLIKGSGYLISAKGKLISSKGEAITKLGKNIATSAVLSPTHGHSEEYHTHHHHSSPEEYGSPSAPGPEYELPNHYHHHPPLHEDKPDSDHHGILILKKIPVHHDHSSKHLPLEHKLPDLKHLKEHKGPGLGEIIGKFFKASTSLKPGEPGPFTDDDHYHHESYKHHEHDHETYHDDDDDHKPYHHEEHDYKTYHNDHDKEHDYKTYHDDHKPYHDDHDHKPYHDDHSSHEDYSSSSHIDNDHEYSSQIQTKSKPKPSSLFEEAPSFLNQPEYPSETKPALDIKPTPKIPIKYDEIRPLPTSFSNLGFDTTSQLSDFNKPNLYLGSFSNKPNLNFPVSQSTQFGFDSNQFGAFSNSGLNPTFQYLATPDVGPQVFPNQNFENPQNPSLYPYNVKYHAHLDNLHASNHRRPTRSKNHSNRKRPVLPPPNLMKVLNKLAANGPKRV